MALAKDSFFSEPLTEDQEQAVKEVEKLIDDGLTANYDGHEVVVRVEQWENREHKRCEIEIARRYQAAGWKFRWYSDARDQDLWAVLS